MAKRQNRPFPKHTLENALVLARGIQDKNAGNPINRLLLADAIDRKPLSSDFRELLSSSYKYGLTEGTEKAEMIKLTELGKKITKPTSPEEEMEAKQKAVLIPEKFKQVFENYNNGKLPPKGKFFENTLEMQFKLSREYVVEFEELLEQNGRFAGLIRDISGSPCVIMGNSSPVETNTDVINEEVPVLKPDANQETMQKPPALDRPKPIFVAHGKNKEAVAQLKKILDNFKIPYKIAIDEPNSGKLIPQKVSELMKQCGSAIFIFTTEGEKTDQDGKIVPNSNVLFELGAASVLYDNKVVIFKEDEVEFPTDLSSIGHIKFEKNRLEAKSLDLLNELIALGFVKIAPA